MSNNKYNETLVLKRLTNIQKMHEEYKKKEDISKYSNKDKIAYILWRDAFSRNSDIYLSIEFYKKFYPNYVKNNMLNLDDLYVIPKMYDIQRTRAEIQNTEGLFPAIEEVRKKRANREAEFSNYYRGTKRKTLRVFPDYYMYLDESGKTHKYFVLAGLLLNGSTDNDAQKTRFNTLKKMLNEQHSLNIGELKFTDINKRNLQFYKDIVDNIFQDGIPAIFISILVENKGLKQKSEKNKSKELLEILLKGHLASLIVRSTCSSPYASNKAKVNITLDKDGCGYDSIEREKMRQGIEDELKKAYKYLIKLESLTDIDSKDDVMVQLSDLYASSINNIFSEIPDNSETAKAKKEFARYLLEKIGLTKLSQEYSKSDSKIKFINKIIPATK